jgi:hypothetical protein
MMMVVMQTVKQCAVEHHQSAGSRCAGRSYGAKSIYALLSTIITLLTCLLVFVIIRVFQQTDAAERCRLQP